MESIRAASLPFAPSLLPMFIAVAFALTTSRPAFSVHFLGLVSTDIERRRGTKTFEYYMAGRSWAEWFGLYDIMYSAPYS